MGAVNLLAIEEFEAVQERFTFLTVQQQDLLEAKTNAGRNDYGNGRRSNYTLQKQHLMQWYQFERTSQDYFMVDVERLTADPENLLETEIEISAQPPGERSILSTSGGERALYGDCTLHHSGNL